jgi:hypothetical protein
MFFGFLWADNAFTITAPAFAATVHVYGDEAITLATGAIRERSHGVMGHAVPGIEHGPVCNVQDFLGFGIQVFIGDLVGGEFLKFRFEVIGVEFNFHFGFNPFQDVFRIGHGTTRERIDLYWSG